MEYNLIRLFGHPLMLDDLLPMALAVFGGPGVTEYRIAVRWRRSSSQQEEQGTLTLRWNMEELEKCFPNLRRRVENMAERDFDHSEQTEKAAVVVTAAVLECLEPGTVFSRRSGKGTYHDYYLNETDNEMVEVAGRRTSEKGLDRLFLEEKAQSDRNPSLRKRWVSVTVFSARPRNRTEGLHP
jgi:hypothetical protein